MGLWDAEPDPAEYERLLAATYDAITPLGVRVWGFGMERRVGTLAFISGVADAYRSSGRTAPLFYGVSHHPYPVAGEPWNVVHEGTSTFAVGDTLRLLDTLDGAFGPTPECPARTGLRAACGPPSGTPRRPPLAARAVVRPGLFLPPSLRRGRLGDGADAHRSGEPGRAGGERPRRDRLPRLHPAGRGLAQLSGRRSGRLVDRGVLPRWDTEACRSGVREPADLRDRGVAPTGPVPFRAREADGTAGLAPPRVPWRRGTPLPRRSAGRRSGRRSEAPRRSTRTERRSQVSP